MASDQIYLHSIALSASDYLSITDEHNLRHGVGLENYRIVLNEYPTILHEIVGGRFEDIVMDMYGRTNLIRFRSASKCLHRK